jgi:hypothetical protein
MLLHALHESSGEPMWTGGLCGEGDGAARSSRVKRQKKMTKGGSGGSFMFGGERRWGGGLAKARGGRPVAPWGQRGRASDGWHDHAAQPA